MNSTVSDVSTKEDMGYGAVMGVIQRHIENKVNWDKIERLNVIGIDEISLKKGRKDFVTIVTARDGDKITIIAVINDRKKEYCEGVFIEYSPTIEKDGHNSLFRYV